MKRTDDRCIAEVRGELRETIAELHTEMRTGFAELSAELKSDNAALGAGLTSRLLRWMFVYWTGTTITLIGVMFAITRL